MPFNKKHIYRNFNASQTNRIRYDSDDFLLEIMAFDKSQERIWKAEDNGTFTVSNGVKTSVANFNVYQAQSDKGMTLTFEYTPTKRGAYRLEFLYANTGRIYGSEGFDYTKDVSADVFINDTKITSTSTWKGNDLVHNRHITQFDVLEKDLNKTLKIQYRNCSANLGFIGLAVKQYDVWTGDRHNKSSSLLTVTNAEINITNELSVDDATFTIMYWHGLDSDTNDSGYVFDYRDEVNFYVWDTNNKKQQVFGGYISTVNGDEDLTNLTITCANRLIDLDHRYNMTEIGLNNIEDIDIYNMNFSLFKNYDNWNDPIKFLCDYVELPLNSNLPNQDKLHKAPITLKYGKKQKLKKLSSVRDMTATFNDNSLLLRNGSQSGTHQSVCIYDKKLTGQSIDAKDFNAIWLEYGLGTHEETRKAKGFDMTGASMLGGSLSGDIVTQASNITSKTGWSAVKPIWQWMANHVKHSDYSNFKQSSKTTLAKMSGNCCDQTRLMLDLMSARGVTNMQYCNSVDHVFARIKHNGEWFIVDPVTKSGWGRAWNNRHNGITKTSDYPNRPF